VTENGNWFARKRCAWIAEMLDIYGFINREHLTKKFGISVPQATNDLRRFQELHPEAMTYNSRTKRYERSVQ
jgi:hypothetical protein